MQLRCCRLASHAVEKAPAFFEARHVADIVFAKEPIAIASKNSIEKVQEDERTSRLQNTHVPSMSRTLAPVSAGAGWAIVFEF
jgi:hypothetical protein